MHTENGRSSVSVVFTMRHFVDRRWLIPSCVVVLVLMTPFTPPSPCHAQRVRHTPEDVPDIRDDGMDLAPAFFNEPNAHLSSLVDGLLMFQDAVNRVEQLVADSEQDRYSALVVLGRTRASSGRFECSSAAYIIFLSEFGLDDPLSAYASERLVDSLFPFDYARIDVYLFEKGPVLLPHWRMGYEPRSLDDIAISIHACELTAALADDEGIRGSALLKLGWVYRVLGDWASSTIAWERCADVAPNIRQGSNGAWLAAENMRYTHQPREEIRLLNRFIEVFPADTRVPAALQYRSAAQDRLDKARARRRR